MAIVKTFLCFSNTRIGSLVCGCYTLVISLICLVFYLFRYVGYRLIEDSAEYKGIVYAGFVLYALMITASLVLIPGVQLDKKYLLLPWIYVVILMVLYETGSIALLTTVHMERDKTLHAWEIVWACFYCFKLLINCYCFACVVSQYQELSEGRGTYEYLYKPNRRRPVRRSFSIDTVDLPFGVHLPPYAEDDPNKQSSPPSYENVYPQPKDNYDEIEVLENVSSVSSNYARNCPSYHRQNQSPNSYTVTVDVVWI